MQCQVLQVNRTAFLRLTFTPETAASINLYAHGQGSALAATKNYSGCTNSCKAVIAVIVLLLRSGGCGGIWRLLAWCSTPNTPRRRLALLDVVGPSMLCGCWAAPSRRAYLVSEHDSAYWHLRSAPSILQPLESWCRILAWRCLPTSSTTRPDQRVAVHVR